MTKLRPMHDRLLVKRIEEEDKTQGGLFIPDTAKQKPMEGKIIAVGEGKLDEGGKLQPIALLQGQRVLFDRHAGTEVQLGGAEHLIIREDDVLAVLE
jgi:chaperonin GroES